MNSKSSLPAQPQATPPEPSTAAQFGLTAGQILRQGSNGKSPLPLQRLTAHVVALSPGPAGRIVIRLDNGQVWEQTEDGPGLQMTHGGEVTIDRGVLGAYFLSAQSKRAAIKVRRIE